MQLTPEELRFLLYFLSAFRESLDVPEREEADALVDRIQEHRVNHGESHRLIGD